MLKPEEMTKLRIYCPKSKLKEVIEEMYNAKAVDLIEHQKEDNIDIGTPLTGVEEISDAAIKARSLIYRLNPEKKAKKSKEDISKVIKSVQQLHEKVDQIYSRLKEINSRNKHLKKILHTVKKIESLGVPLKYYQETSHIKYFIGQLETLGDLEKELQENLGNNYELHSKKDDKKYLISIFIDKSKEWELLKVLKEHTFSEVKIPEEVIGKDNPIETLQNEIGSLKSEKEELNKKITEIKNKHGAELSEKERRLTQSAKIAEAPLKFGETQNIAIISGWVPSKTKAKVQKRIEEITKGDYHIEQLQISEKDSAPVQLRNPKAARPYEFLLRLFSMPSYKEIDPTLFMFITFPLFFGFMLGDIGYGITTLALFMVLKKYFPQGKDLFNILMFSSGATILFGIIFGEFFGVELAHVHAIGHWMEANHLHFFHRSPNEMSNIFNLMTIAGIVGAIHVNLGLFFGFINIYKHHGVKHAVLEKGSWVLLELGAALAVLSVLKILPLTIWPGMIVIVASAIMLYFGEGIKGLIELPQVFVHIGSYLRLMAIGVASVSLAMVINQQASPLLQSGIGGIIAGIIILTVGHTINIALGIIGPFLHSLRLHYVEHFTKFYEGGGREFKPFGAE